MYTPRTGAPISCVARHRPVEQQLIHGQFTLKDIAFGEAHFVFDIPGRANLGMQNQLLEIRAVLRDGIDHGIAEGLASRRPDGPSASS